MVTKGAQTRLRTLLSYLIRGVHRKKGPPGSSRIKEALEKARKDLYKKKEEEKGGKIMLR